MSLWNHVLFWYQYIYIFHCCNRSNPKITHLSWHDYLSIRSYVEVTLSVLTRRTMTISNTTFSTFEKHIKTEDRIIYFNMNRNSTQGWPCLQGLAMPCWIILPVFTTVEIPYAWNVECEFSQLSYVQLRGPYGFNQYDNTTLQPKSA